MQVARRRRPLVALVAVARRAGLRRLAPGEEGRLHAADGQGVVGAGEDEVEFGQAIHDALDALTLLGHLLRQHAQDTLNLLLLLHQQAAILVVQLDRGQRLHPQRRAAAALVVDDALQPPLGVGAQGDDVASAALGDDRLLQILGHAAAEDALQPVLDAGMDGALLLAYLGQARAGAVQHLAALVNGAADGADQAATLLDQHGDGRQIGHAILQAQQLPPQVAPGDDAGLDGQQILGRQREAAQSVVGRPAHVARAADGHAAVGLEQRYRLARLGLPLAGLLQFRRRLHGQGQFAATAKVSVPGHQFAYLVEFQYRQ